MDETPDRRACDGPPPPGKVWAELWAGPADGGVLAVPCGVLRVRVPVLTDDGFAALTYERTHTRTRSGAVIYRYGSASVVGPRGAD